MGPVTTLLLCWLGAGVTIWALLGGWKRYPEAGDPVTPVTPPPVTDVASPLQPRPLTSTERSRRHRAKRKKGRPS